MEPGQKNPRDLFRASFSILSGRWLRRVFGFCLGGGFLYLAARGVDVSAVHSILLNTELAWLGPMALIYIASLCLRSLRWSWMFPLATRPSVREAFTAFMIGAAANNVMPGRLGDLLRAVLIGRRVPEVGTGGALATIVLEKVIDALIVLGFLGVAFLWAPLPEWLAQAGVFGTVVFGVALVVLILLNSGGKRAGPAPTDVAGASLADRIVTWLRRALQRFASGLGALSSRKEFLMLLVSGLVIWLLDALVIFAGFQAFEITLSFVAAIVTMVFLCMGMMLPAAPGFIGTYQFFVIAALALYGIPESQGLALAVFLNVFIIVLTTTLGVAVILVTSGFARTRRALTSL